MTPWALTFAECSFSVPSTNYRQYTILNVLQVSEKTLLMQKIVDLENTIGILKPYSNFESLIFSGKCIKKNLVNWKNFVKTNICEKSNVQGVGIWACLGLEYMK